MGFKKEQKKKQIRKRNLIQDPDASMSSEFSYQDNQDGFSIEEEIDEKLQQQAQDFSDNDIEDLDLPEQEIESADDNKEDILQNIDIKLKQSLQDLLISIKNQPQILEKYQASYILSILFYFLKKNNFNEDIADHPVLNYISTFEENQQILKNIKFQQKQKVQVQEKEQIQQAEVQIQNNEQPRLITKAMYKNKGVPKSSGYKKQIQNPRLKQKKKFEKAKEVMVSRGLLKKKKIGKHYQGETGGIKMGVDRTINIDQLNFIVFTLQ